MSGKSSTEGHWEKHSATAKAVKIGNNPASISGHEESAEGTFDVSQLFFIYTNSIHFIITLFSMVKQ